MSRAGLDMWPTPLLVGVLTPGLIALGISASLTSLDCPEFPTRLATQERAASFAGEDRDWRTEQVDLELGGSLCEARESGVAPEPVPDWTLVAVEWAADGPRAFVAVGAESRLHTLHPADEFRGQRVLDISSTGVRWRQRDDQSEWQLPLQEASS